jgi:hypothetical protein
MTMDITTSIGAFDAATRNVPVTFTYAGVTHQREVNAVLDATGAYDAQGTAQRVDAVARGVKVKVDLGVITNAPEPAENATPATGTESSAAAS